MRKKTMPMVMVLMMVLSLMFGYGYSAEAAGSGTAAVTAASISAETHASQTADASAKNSKAKTSAKSDGIVETEDGMLCYGFSEAMDRGADRDGNLAFLHGECGVYGWFDKDGRVCYEAYDDTGAHKLKSISFVVNNKNMKSGAASRKNLAKGVHKITAEFAGVEKKVNLTLYSDGSDAWFCMNTRTNTEECWDYARNYTARKETLDKAVKSAKVTPENSLDISDIAYPTWADGDAYRCDTMLWAELAHEIAEEDWSNGRKAYAFYSWIVDNCAYDRYKVKMGKPRYVLNDDWSGKWNLIETHVGVCADFSHAFLIMCRETGVPCVTVESGNHEWNAVWLDGRWVEVDITASVPRYVDTENIAKWKNYPSAPFGRGWRIGFEAMGEDPIKVNADLWTTDRAMGFE